MAQYTTSYLIVGNCAAGIAGAEAIRAAAPEASVLMVSNEPYAAYGRPLISYVMENVTTEDAIWLKTPDYYESNKFETLFGPEYAVVAMDAAAHVVTLANGDTISYEKCLVATGSNPHVPETPGLGEQENVFTFTTLDMAKALTAEAQRATQQAHEQGRASVAMVSGAGLIGLKAAEALVGLVDEVVVVGRAPFLLRAVLDPTAGALLQSKLEAHGITCLTGVTASEYKSEDNRIVAAVLADGREVACDLLVMAAGVRPNCAFAQAAGAEVGKGLVVDACQQTTLPDVYAAGDVAQIENMLDGTVGPLAQWPNAVRQGRVAGMNMAGVAPSPEQPVGNYPVNATNFFDVSVLTCGMTNPAAEAGYDVTVFAEADTYAKFVTKENRLCGFVLVNRPENAGMYTELIAKATPLSELPADVFDRPCCNIDYQAQKRWERLHRGCPQALRAGI